MWKSDGIRNQAQRMRCIYFNSFGPQFQFPQLPSDFDETDLIQVYSKDYDVSAMSPFVIIAGL